MKMHANSDLKNSKNMSSVKNNVKNKNKSIFTRIGSFLKNLVCCSGSYKIDDHEKDYFIDYQSRELVNYGNGHYYSNNPSLFYLRDFIETDSVINNNLKSEKIVENAIEPIMNVDDDCMIDFCRSIIHGIIDDVKMNVKKVKRVTFDEYMYVYEI